MTAALALQLDHALEGVLGPGRGLSECAVQRSGQRLRDVPAWVEEQGERLAFLDLPRDVGAAGAASAWAAAAPPARDVVVVGIGGSALPARLLAALRSPTTPAPRLHVVDTVDPSAVEGLRAVLDPCRTLLLGITKSGATLETTTVFAVFDAWLRDALGARATARTAVVTGPQDSPLRRHAERAGIACFEVPPAVGGRYSALSAVGLLPAACVGLDPLALLAGAEEARTACLTPTLEANPAIALAAVHHAAQEAGRGVCVLWPYGEALRPVGPWAVQLIAESLGKPGPHGPTGVTAVAASGPADQHSLLQLLVQGPDDKLVVLLDAPSTSTLVVPDRAPDLTPAAGRRLRDVAAAEYEATAFALASAGRPVVRLRLSAADERSVGALLLTYEAAVVYWGRLLGVDPFGQPGVALGKAAALAALRGEPADLAARLAAWRRRSAP